MGQLNVCLVAAAVDNAASTVASADVVKQHRLDYAFEGLLGSVWLDEKLLH